MEKGKTLFDSSTGESFVGLSAKQIEAKFSERARDLDKLEKELFSRSSLLADNCLSKHDSNRLNEQLYGYLDIGEDFWLPNSQQPLNFD